MAVSVTAADFRERFPHLDGATGRIELLLAEAARQVNDDQWGARAFDGRLYLAAHLFSVDSQQASGGASSGPATQCRVGDVSTSFAVGGMFSNDALGSTSYGAHYLSLRRMVIPSRCL